MSNTAPTKIISIVEQWLETKHKDLMDGEGLHNRLDSARRWHVAFRKYEAEVSTRKPMTPSEFRDELTRLSDKPGSRVTMQSYAAGNHTQTKYRLLLSPVPAAPAPTPAEDPHRVVATVATRPLKAAAVGPMWMDARADHTLTGERLERFLSESFVLLSNMMAAQAPERDLEFVSGVREYAKAHRRVSCKQANALEKATRRYPFDEDNTLRMLRTHLAVQQLVTDLAPVDA